MLISVRCDVPEGSSAEVQLSVSDTGVGISKDIQGGLFQPFVQADSSITRNYGGTGLGLTICKGLTEMMEGRIWVESEPGEGSSFHCALSLPLFENADAHDGTSLDRFSMVRALVVDDNPVTRRTVRDTLEDWGMQAVSSGSGKAALAMLTSPGGDAVNMLVVDARMPDMDGFELIEQTRNLPGSSIPTVLMLSAGYCEREASCCRNLGLSSYLAKPVFQADLLDAILVAMGRRHRMGRGASECVESFDQEKPLRILLAEARV